MMSSGLVVLPRILDELFSWHSVKDLNFLSQVIRRSEAIREGVLTRVRHLSNQHKAAEHLTGNGNTSCQSSVNASSENWTDHSAAYHDNSSDVTWQMQDDMQRCEGYNRPIEQGNQSEQNLSRSAAESERWSPELEENWDVDAAAPSQPQPWSECDPHMAKLYRQKLKLIDLEAPRDEAGPPDTTDQGQADNAEASASTIEAFPRQLPKPQLDMNKLVKGGKRLFVRNINFRTNQHKLWQFFKTFGKVKDCELLKAKHNKKSRGLAFVTFAKVEEAERVLNATEEELTLDDWVLKVELARPRKYEKQMTQSEEDQWQPEYLEDGTAGATDMLSDDALLHIFSYLTICQRITCERVCRRWRKLALQSWQSVSTISLQGLFKVFELMTDRSMRSLLSRCTPAMTTIHLTVAARLLSDKTLDAIGHYCPGVQNVAFKGLDITNRGFTKFVKNCTNIQVFKMENCSNVKEDGIWWLFNCCRDLREVDLSGCKRIAGQCLHVMGTNIKRLVLNQCPKLQDVAMEKISRKCGNLQELHISGCSALSDAALTNLAKNSVVNTLNTISMTDVFPKMTGEGLRQLELFPNLEEVYLSQNSLVDDVTLLRLSACCKSLRVLDIGGCGHGITDFGVSRLGGRLEELSISYLSSVSDTGLESIANNCPRLKSLRARYCIEITDPGVLALITSCRRLCELDVCGCISLTNAILVQLVHELDVREHTSTFSIYVGGTNMDTQVMDLPDSITVDTIPYKPLVYGYDLSAFNFLPGEDSDEEYLSEIEDQYDEFEELLQSDDPFLVAEMEWS